jgi:hypothetical protein
MKCETILSIKFLDNYGLIYALHEKALCLYIHAGLMAQFLNSRIPKYPLKKEI